MKLFLCSLFFVYVKFIASEQSGAFILRKRRVAMNDKEKMKKFADGLRETASVIDEIVENDDEEKEEELLGKFVVKLMKLEKLKSDI